MAPKKTPKASAVTTEQLLAAIAVIELACVMLTALIPIIKGWLGAFEAQERALKK